MVPDSHPEVPLCTSTRPSRVAMVVRFEVPPTSVEAMEEEVQSDLGSGPLASFTADAVDQGLTGEDALRFVATRFLDEGSQIDRRHLLDADKSLALTIEQMTAIMRVLGVVQPAPSAAARRPWTAERRTTEYFQSLLEAIRNMTEELQAPPCSYAALLSTPSRRSATAYAINLSPGSLTLCQGPCAGSNSTCSADRCSAVAHHLCFQSIFPRLDSSSSGSGVRMTTRT